MMKAKITDKAQFRPWEPERHLRPFGLNEVRFSRGFMRVDLAAWFQNLKAHWLPLFHVLDAPVEFEGVDIALDFPDSLDRIVAIEIDNEAAVIGLDAASERTIAHAVVPAADEKSAEVVIEYLLRRFLSAVTRSWTGAVPLTCSTAAAGASEEIEVTGAICARLKLHGDEVKLWIGIGPTLAERFDSLWREQVAEGAVKGGTGVHVCGVELGSFAVSPELLTDYLKPGAVIQLDGLSGGNVIVRMDGSPWASGVLGSYNGRFAVELQEMLAQPAPQKSPLTEVHIEVGSAELDAAGKAEHSQPGAILLTRSTISSNAALLISGETVATASVGTINGRYALHILPK